VTDSFAYFTGRLIGKHKLAESISPKKTVEGAAGGAVFGIAAVYLFGYFGQEAFGVDIPVYWYAILGALLTALSQLGDLAASKIKRYFNAKDFGKIMGAHGGMMDRLDSMLFVVPAVYGFYTILF
jgi:phosphatidate cytidylyltransferase